MTDFLTALPVNLAVPIERHSLLSDRRAFALITPDADVTWLCHPAPDSPALFAALLGGSGHFSVRPQKDQLPLGQRYAPGTMTVQTRWTGLRVTDHLASALVRTVEGRVPAVVEFAPRPDFGRAPVVLEKVADGLRVTGTPIVLRSPGVDWQIADGTATAVITPPFVLELQLGSPSEVDSDWSEWSASLRLPATERELVRRSALTLRALCHRDTGAVLAAATTSLPEQIGGVRIAAEVLERGWNPDVRAFTTAYDGTDLDAASLHVGLSGLLDPSDERFRATVVAVEETLRSGPTVYRYLRNDGLPGDEGGFHLCTAWLIEAYLRVGRRADAEELFESFVRLAGPTGLLPEEYDPVAERSLGNHPQAYSHLGLIRCARLLD